APPAPAPRPARPAADGGSPKPTPRPSWETYRMSANSFDAKATLSVGGTDYEIFRLDALQQKYDVARLPYSLKILLENLLRNEDGENITSADVEALAKWNAKGEQTDEISFTPARVV